MVPDKFNMVDMGGIDLIMMQGEEVPGLYNRLVESIAQCRYQCLYNWLFDGVIIPPTYVELEVNENDEVAINEGVTVSPDDVIHIYSIEPGPVDPQIIPLLAEENGVYNVPADKDGFNPVTVDVPSYTPVIESITITENGTYVVPEGVDGFGPIIVNVEGGGGMTVTDLCSVQNYGTTQVNIGDISSYDMIMFDVYPTDPNYHQPLYYPPSEFTNASPYLTTYSEVAVARWSYNSTTGMFSMYSGSMSIRQLKGIKF